MKTGTSKIIQLVAWSICLGMILGSVITDCRYKHKFDVEKTATIVKVGE